MVSSAIELLDAFDLLEILLNAELFTTELFTAELLIAKLLAVILVVFELLIAVSSDLLELPPPPQELRPTNKRMLHISLKHAFE